MAAGNFAPSPAERTLCRVSAWCGRSEGRESARLHVTTQGKSRMSYYGEQYLFDMF